MKNQNLLRIAGGVGVLGVAGYFLLRSRNANAATSGVPTSVYQSAADKEARDLAALRAAGGAKAISQNGSGSFDSLINQVTSGSSSQFSNYLAGAMGGGGSGSANDVLTKIGGDVAANLASKGASYLVSNGKSVGSKVVSGLKKLKFW